MPPIQRVRLGLAIGGAVLAATILVILLVDGSRWYGWVLVATTAGMAALQAREFNQARNHEGGPPTR